MSILLCRAATTSSASSRSGDGELDSNLGASSVRHEIDLQRAGEAGNGSDLGGLCNVGVVRALMVEVGKWMAGIGLSTVFLRRKVGSRFKLLLNLVYEDLIDDTEVMEAGQDDTVVTDDELLGCLYSLVLSEVSCVDCEVREGAVSSSTTDSKVRAETLLVTRSKVVLGFWGTLMPRSMAMRRNCWSTSSSVQSLAKRSTIIL